MDPADKVTALTEAPAVPTVAETRLRVIRVQRSPTSSRLAGHLTMPAAPLVETADSMAAATPSVAAVLGVGEAALPATADKNSPQNKGLLLLLEVSSFSGSFFMRTNSLCHCIYVGEE